MLPVRWSGGGHPSITILITISIFLLITPSSMVSSDSDSSPAHRSPSFADADEADLSNNIPLEVCENSEHHSATLRMVFMDPQCEPAPQNYCGLRRNQNYTLITIFKPKRVIKALFVRVTTRDPLYGWETLIWPEFSVCNRFNITCPQTSTDSIRTYVMDAIPVPPMRALVRVRLFGVGEDNVKRIIVCRQFKAHVF